MPAPYRGLSREAARKKIVADLEALGLLDKIEPITHAVPHDEKTKTVVLEPLLTEQWYLNVEPLADKAIAAVEKGETKFVPENWTECLFRLDAQHPALVHFAPALVGPSDSGLVRRRRQDLLRRDRSRGDRPGRRQDADPRSGRARHLVLLGAVAVLDPGLAGQDAGAEALLSHQVLVTGFDIIFFWVARMMMMGMHFMGEVPFKTVFIHNRVLDEQGAKMSKTKGNVVDPLTLIDEFGADALALHPGAGRRAEPRHAHRPDAGGSRAATSPPNCGTPRASAR